MRHVTNWLSSIALVAIACACASTVTPRRLSDRIPSWDSDQQNSGFLGYTTNGWGIITGHARDRYNALVAEQGSAFLPPLAPDAGLVPAATNTWLIDPEHLVDFGVMNRRHKSKP